VSSVEIPSRRSARGNGRHLVARLASLAVAIAAYSNAPVALAQDVLIRNAKVHTADARGTLDGTDVRVRAGRIAEIGPNLPAAAGEVSVDAKGRPLTPGLFAGVNVHGLEEVSLEESTVDHAYAPGTQAPPAAVLMRPEFDVMRAFNPASGVIPVTRAEGYTYAVVTPSGAPGGTFLAGQGAAVTLSGAVDSELAGSRTLFVQLGAQAAALAGKSRAAEWMLLDQALAEAKPGHVQAEGDERVLTAAGRTVLAKFLAGGRVAFNVDRAQDIRELLALSKRLGIQPVILGGAQATEVAAELAARKVPVVLDPFLNLPGSFDQLGVTLQNAKRLHQAGVRIAFSNGETHNARKNRQGAGIAVAYGLPWDAALAALTATPAEIFGMGAERGRIATGLAADLVLWSGDPLEVTSVAEAVWIAGRAQDLRTRQGALRDRYLTDKPVLPRAYSPVR